MTKGLILMTALPPTKGHQFLVDFAKNFLSVKGDYELFVIISGRKHEPIPLDWRVLAFDPSDPRVKFIRMDRAMPQEPREHPQFWKIWQGEIEKLTGQEKFDFVFASEEYGKTLADIVRGVFVPCNIYREVVDAKATLIREDSLEFFNMLHPRFQEKARQTITIFGPESVGKTTLSKALAHDENGYYCPEWAREYLEMIAGPEITQEKMAMIVEGQSALEKAVENLIDKPFIFKDTDLLSTYGYYILWGKAAPSDLIHRIKLADLYILPNDKIPFTPDPLRYGGDKRESNNKYWIDILEKFGAEYYELQSFDANVQLEEAGKVCRNLYYRKNNWRFER